MASVNIQQIPKVQPLMELLRADPGHVLIDSDLASLEPRVVAFFSRDESLLKLYASGEEHDVYLYVAMAIFPERRDVIHAVYYRGGSPSKESVADAKATFQKERKIAKEVHLAAGYGASAWKIWQTVNLRGIAITIAEAERIHQLYWELFGGIRAWERRLRMEREDRGGWILNGRGRPLAVPEHRVKDMANMFAQSTGHDCLLTLVYYIDRFRRERGVPMRPWIPDFHDQTTWQVPEEHADAAVAVFEDAYAALNEELGSDVPLTGGIDRGYNLWQFKAG